MPLAVLTGGARSGKSRLAVALAERNGAPVVYLATGDARDDEMRVRIARHRSERPTGWTTVEEPVDVARVLSSVDGTGTVILDCLSLWVANLLEAGHGEEAVLGRCDEAVGAAVARPGLTIAVTNEVGLGVVPVSPLGRAFRDLLGIVNARWVAAADRAALVVAGRLVRLDPADALIAWAER